MNSNKKGCLFRLNKWFEGIKSCKAEIGPLQAMITGLLLVSLLAGLGLVFLTETAEIYDVTVSEESTLQTFSNSTPIQNVISDVETEFVGENSTQVVESVDSDVNIFRSALNVGQVVIALPATTFSLVNEAINLIVPDALEGLVAPIMWSLLVITVLFGMIALILRWRG